MLITAPAAAWVFADELGLKHADHKKVKLYAVVYVRNLLSKQLKAAKDDLLHAAAFDPMYGALHVIRCIYGELDQDDINDDNTWTELTKDLVVLGYDVWKVVSPVVASDSPEGHLPMDNVSFDHYFIKKNTRLDMPFHNYFDYSKITYSLS